MSKACLFFLNFLVSYATKMCLKIKICENCTILVTFNKILIISFKK